MHKRTRACSISRKTKLRVFERDQGCCIFCGRPGLPEAHVVPRSHGGLGIEENIVTACRPCHDMLDNSDFRQRMLEMAVEHLRQFYPDWNINDFIYEKWPKDKGSEPIEKQKAQMYGIFDNPTQENGGKDKGKPPEGFYFLGGDDERD